MAFSDVKSAFKELPEYFNPDAAKGLEIVYQYMLSGDDGADYQVIIKDGSCEVIEGKHEKPNVTLEMSSETFLGIVNKQINGFQAFMTGKIKATGDLILAQKFPSLFNTP